MSSPNLNLRDPVLYESCTRIILKPVINGRFIPLMTLLMVSRIQSKGITHSLCTLEFEHHRPLYDWFCQNLGIHHPQQIEFARLNLNYTVMSKRKMLRLVEEGLVDGWDDPRMPTLSGMRRGVTPRLPSAPFVKRVGLAKRKTLLKWNCSNSAFGRI